MYPHGGCCSCRRPSTCCMGVEWLISYVYHILQGDARDRWNDAAYHASAFEMEAYAHEAEAKLPVLAPVGSRSSILRKNLCIMKRALLIASVLSLCMVSCSPSRVLVQSRQTDSVRIDRENPDSNANKICSGHRTYSRSANERNSRAIRHIAPRNEICRLRCLHTSRREIISRLTE